MTVKAIYSYTARNQKELSFSAGETLQVTEKTSDGNWWDGFHHSKRGYIPVTYVEITEVRLAAKSPLPPERRSSTQTAVPDGSEATTKETNEVESGAPSKQVEYVKQLSAPPLSPSVDEKDSSPQPELVVSPTHQPLSPTHLAPPTASSIQEEIQPRVSSPETTSTFKPVGVNVQSATLPGRAKEFPTPVVPKMPTAGNVKNKMAQFLSSSQPHQSTPSDVPARPSSPGHRRMKSEGSNLDHKSVRQLTQAYNPSTAEKPPPPTRPKPRPSAELTRNKEALEQAINFPIMPHTGGVTQVSPLQQKVFSAVTDPHQQQPPPPPPQQQQKPAVLTKPKGSFRKTTKKVTKPPPPPQSTAPPKGAFIAPPTSNPRDPTALHEELRAVASARTRKTEKDTTV